MQRNQHIMPIEHNITIATHLQCHSKPVGKESSHAAWSLIAERTTSFVPDESIISYNTFMMKIYGLIGKSGTGKSFQAVGFCERENIKGIIDDGLFIMNGAILAGMSAKRQVTKVGAIKEA